MRRIEADRRQQRLDFALHVVAQPCALFGGALRVIDDHDVLLCQRRHDRVVVKLVLLSHQPVRTLQHGRVHLRGRRR